MERKRGEKEKTRVTREKGDSAQVGIETLSFVERSILVDGEVAFDKFGGGGWGVISFTEFVGAAG